MTADSNSSVSFNGDLDNTNAVLNLDQFETNQIIFGNAGSVLSGGISGSSGAKVLNFSNVLFDDVSLLTDLTILEGASLTIVNDITLVFSDIILQGSQNAARIRVNGNQTIDGIGQILFSGQNAQSHNNIYAGLGSSVLTIAEGITIKTVSGNAELGTGSLNAVLNGNIEHRLEGGVLNIALGNFSIHGVMSVGKTSRINVSAGTAIFSSQAELQLDFSVLDMGKLDFAQAPSFAGALEFKLQGETLPDVCQAFEFASYPTKTGVFNTIIGPVISNGETFSVFYNPTAAVATAPGIDCVN